MAANIPSVQIMCVFLNLSTGLLMFRLQFLSKTDVDESWTVLFGWDANPKLNNDPGESGIVIPSARGTDMTRETRLNKNDWVKILKKPGKVAKKSVNNSNCHIF